MTCPKCGGRGASRIKVKDGAVFAGPCKACSAKEREETHEIIARLALRAGEK